MSNLRWLPPILLTLLGAAAASLLVPRELAQVAEQFIGFPESDVFSNNLRPYILAALCLMPALAALYYSSCNTFDRYLSREFFGIFFTCFCCLFSIWLLLDLSDNFSDFKNSKGKFLALTTFYLYRAPAIFLQLLPYSLLFSLVYGLGKFSKSNEIIAMIQSGKGIIRISLPLIFAGVWSSIFLVGVNFHWAPRAEGMRAELTARANGLPVLQAQNVLYRDPDSNRLWMVGAFPENFYKGAPLQNVEITSLNSDRTIKSRIFTPSASWDRQSKKWTFENPLVATFTAGEAPEFEQLTSPFHPSEWNETPSRIIKPGLAVEFLGIPELSSWLRSPLASQPTSNRAAYLTHWQYRWALPTTCLVTVLLAAPLSIHFSRRGAGSGVFIAVVLSVLMLFVSSITLTLGEAGIIPPILAAWGPNITFSLIGIFIFHRRISCRPILQSIRFFLNPPTLTQPTYGSQ